MGKTIRADKSDSRSKGKLKSRTEWRVERAVRGEKIVLGEVLADVPYSMAHGRNAVEAVEAEGRQE